MKFDKKFGTLHEFACHPCAGAMLIFLKGFSLVMAMKRKAKFQLTLYLSNFIIRSLEEQGRSAILSAI